MWAGVWDLTSKASSQWQIAANLTRRRCGHLSCFIATCNLWLPSQLFNRCLSAWCRSECSAEAVELNAIAAAAVSPCFPSSFLHPSLLLRGYHFWRRFMKCPVLRSAAHLRFMKRPLREKEKKRERCNPIYQPLFLLWLCRYNLAQMHHSVKEGLFDVRRWIR